MLLLEILFLVFGSAFTLPTNEFNGAINEGDLLMNEHPYNSLMGIVPSGYSPYKIYKENQVTVTDIFEVEDEVRVVLNDIMNKGHAAKGLTFNIYDDGMRNSAITLYYLLRDSDEKTTTKIVHWSKQNINDDMFDYAWRLSKLFGRKSNHDMSPPPFITKPNYFVNSETILKAAKLKINNGYFHPVEAKSNQFFRAKSQFPDAIIINSNYSNWNDYDMTCEDKLNYFKEDVGLNSYYYGIHLLHPFWMPNSEMDEANPRHAEHYYYSHQQLIARYILETAHLENDGSELNAECKNVYRPNLIYDNGLSFPVRFLSNEEWSEGRAYLSSLDIAMKECISRGLVIMENGATVNMTEENHVDLIAKLVKANLDGVKAAKTIRALYGYGGKFKEIDRYNPAPSVLHHPQTSLRDSKFWDLIKYMLSYFNDFKATLNPFDLNNYETEDIQIIKASVQNITTYFSNYEFDISKVFDSTDVKSPINIAARHRRLKHMPFKFEFSVESIKEQDVIVRLFMGPQCTDNCWNIYNRFFELDCYPALLKKGSNSLIWSPKLSSRFSDDFPFNYESNSEKRKNYNMYKFPETLSIPHGTSDGLKLSVFIMITSVEETDKSNIVRESNLLQNLSNEPDRKPLGFPFHGVAINYNVSASNYKFFNISVYHKVTFLDKNGVYSPYLY